MVIEVVNPDRFRSVFKMANVGTAESITVGRQTRSRNITPRSAGRWECTSGDAPVQSLLPQDITADYFDYDAPLTIALPSSG